MSTRNRTILGIAFLFMTAALIGCGGAGSSSESGTPPPAESGTPPPADSGTPLPAKTLSWEPPTSYVDATSMNPVTDLDRFEIYVNETGSFTDTDTPMAALSAVDPATHKATTSFDLANLSPHVTVGPQYHVSLRAVALTGLKSDFSPPVSFSF